MMVDLSLRAYGRASGMQDNAHHLWHWHMQDPWGLICFARVGHSNCGEIVTDFMYFYLYCINKLGATCYFLVYRKFARSQGGRLSLKHREKASGKNNFLAQPSLGIGCNCLQPYTSASDHHFSSWTPAQDCVSAREMCSWRGGSFLFLL